MSVASGPAQRTSVWEMIRPCLVRVLTSDKAVVGAGFLVDQRHVLTCAHVAEAALGLPTPSEQKPTNPISLDFPLLAMGDAMVGHVDLWRPPAAAGTAQKTEDLAVLELTADAPMGSAPARVLAVDSFWDHRFGAIGFPRGYDSGVWASGVLRAEQGDGWVQIDGVNDIGYFVVPGFSGAPIWDEQVDGIVGMVVASERRTEVRAAYMLPGSALLAAWSGLVGQVLPPCPYRGLFPFREEDKDVFRGRDRVVAQMRSAVDTTTMVTVMGPSGCGKSSAVFAGLLPQLRADGKSLVATFRPGDRPFYALARALVPLLEQEAPETDQLIRAASLGDALAQGQVKLRDIVTRLLEKYAGRSRVLLVVDQFEELYTVCASPEECEHFLDVLLDAIGDGAGRGDGSLCVLVTLRADFLGHALSYGPVVDALQNAARILIGPMNRDELQAAIEEPARSQGVTLEDGLTDRILDAVGRQPGDLPLVEFALTLLWQKQENGVLTHHAYQDIGGVERALSNHADEIYSRLSAEDQMRAKRIFLQLVQPGEKTEDTRRVASRSDIGDDSWPVVQALAAARLVVTNQRVEESRAAVTGEETVEVVHEALIRGWSRLREWMDADRAFRVWQESLRGAVHEWEHCDYDKASLWRGTLLKEAGRWVEEHSADLSEPEQRFLSASRKQLLLIRLSYGLGALGVVAALIGVYALASYLRPQPHADVAQQISASPVGPPSSPNWQVQLYLEGHGNAAVDPLVVKLHLRGADDPDQAQKFTVLQPLSIGDHPGLPDGYIRAYQLSTRRCNGDFYRIEIRKFEPGDSASLQEVIHIKDPALLRRLQSDMTVVNSVFLQIPPDPLKPGAQAKTTSRLERDLHDLVSYSYISPSGPVRPLFQMADESASCSG